MATAHQVTTGTRLHIKQIAVLTDLSQNAETALRFAATVARGYNAGIILAHSYLPSSNAYAAPNMKLVYEALDVYREDLENQLLTQTEAPFLRDIHCMVVLSQGSPRQLLEDLKDTDLIVVGTSGATGMEKAALGSTAETIFRSSPLPVLTVGPHCGGKEDVELDTVLYATDFSPEAAAALPYALSIASEHNAKLVLLHVVDNKDVSFSFERTMASAKPLERLHRLVPRGIDLKFQPICRVSFGKPQTAIIDEAKNVGARIIVIGARGANAFASAVSHLTGGTAYRVAANAPCPVLTIRKA